MLVKNSNAHDGQHCEKDVVKGGEAGAEQHAPRPQSNGALVTERRRGGIKASICKAMEELVM